MGSRDDSLTDRALRLAAEGRGHTLRARGPVPVGARIGAVCQLAAALVRLTNRPLTVALRLCHDHCLL